MRKVTTLFFALALSFAGASFGQTTEFLLDVPVSADAMAPFSVGLHSGARGMSGPFDLDGDGKLEMLISEYSGGGRVHVIENAGANTWELVYSTPWLDATSSSRNGRIAAGGDLDGDGKGEIIVTGGTSYATGSPYARGMFVWEFTGTDNDFGTAPATIYDFGTDPPDRFVSEQMLVDDVDGDGQNELLFANNGSNNDYDNWWILSVVGDIGTGFDVWIVEARISSRASQTFDPVNRGGGSPYGIHPADLDGDGSKEFSMTSWNNFNFSNGDVTGPNSYALPDASDSNVFIQAAASDNVSLFGGTVVDIDGDGDDEVFYPEFQTGNVAMLNYESGENPLEITGDQLIYGLLPGLGALGITAGDMSGDGAPDIITAGPGYTATSYNNGDPSNWLRVGIFNGGNPEDPSNWEVRSLDTSFDGDTTHFDTIYRDSLGTMTKYFETASGLFPAKVAYLGDADNDGFAEVAASFQSVSDSLDIIDEVWNAGTSSYDRTVRERVAAPHRYFMRIFSSDNLFTTREHDIIVPDDYKLSANYPNPFNPTTSFDFTLPLDKAVSVKVYDMMGRLVKTVINNQFLPKGTHTARWDGTNDLGQSVSSGTYLYTLEYGNFRKSRTMVLLK